MKAKIIVLLFSMCVLACSQKLETPIEQEIIEKAPQLSMNSSSKNHLILLDKEFQMSVAANAEDETSNYYWQHIANADALNYDGEDLSATSIELTNNVAYVTYHKRGTIHKGALELIDISKPNSPASLGFIPFQNADINAVAIDPNQANIIWLAGSSAKIGAALYRLELDDSFNVLAYDRINLSKSLVGGISASANGIYLTQEYVYVSCGKSIGGILKVNKDDLSVNVSEEFSGAKSIAGNMFLGIDYYAALQNGNTSSLIVKRAETDDVQLRLNMSSSTHQSVDLPHDGKYDLQFSNRNPAEIYVTAGMDGVKSLNMLTGESIKVTKDELLPNGNTNAVFIDDEFIYLANGEDGLSIALNDLAENTGVIEPIFRWDLPEKPASVNFVTADNGYVYVAKGLGGFHILKYTSSNKYKTVLPFNKYGTPIGMTTEDYCPEIISNILAKALPPGMNAIVNNPEYFQNPNSSFFLEREATVKVTFLKEDAGFKNTLGYYTYNISNAPASIDELDKTIIFPNASAQYSGGELIPGKTVNILGTFPAGTVFGFYLVSNGWSNEITDGLYTQYSDWLFNSNALQQNLIFYDQSCDAFVICFEDMLIPGGDKDFNDAIFKVTASPKEAFTKSAYLQIR